MLDQLRREVLEANLVLPARGLVTSTWGNVSAIDRDRGLIVIKGSGVPYESMGIEDMVVIDESGRVVQGGSPSIDTPTHLALYKAFGELGAIVHTHSAWATAWAQARRPIPVLGTTHADFSPFPVPVARMLSDHEVAVAYEHGVGELLVEAIGERSVWEVPAALVPSHGPFAWGRDPATALENAITLEEVARFALLTEALRPQGAPLGDAVRLKHYERKHGPRAYYGQRTT